MVLGKTKHGARAHCYTMSQEDTCYLERVRVEKFNRNAEGISRISLVSRRHPSDVKFNRRERETMMHDAKTDLVDLYSYKAERSKENTMSQKS